MIFQLRIDNPQTAVSETIALPAGETVTLGRAAADIPLAHPFVDEAHAQLAVTDDGVTLTDLESVNGTAVNGHRIPPNQPIPLTPGDVVEIALFQLTLLVVAPVTEETDSEEETAAAEQPDPEPEAVVAAAGQSDDEKDDKKDKSMQPSAPYPQTYWKPMQALGFERDFCRYVQYLPALYDVPFMHRFLALFESLLQPIIWRIDSRDLLLDGQTAPEPFLPWLARWFGFSFDHTWSEAQKRAFLTAVPDLVGWWGTPRALQTVLDIYVGRSVTLIDDDSQPPFTFRVEVPLAHSEARAEEIARLINAQKPAHSSFELHFTESPSARGEAGA